MIGVLMKKIYYQQLVLKLQRFRLFTKFNRNNQKTDQFDKNIPIILLSNTKNKKEFVKYIKIGISDFIIKPYTKERLSTAFNKFLFNSKPLIKKENFNFTYNKIMQFELKKSKKENIH